MSHLLKLRVGQAAYDDIRSRLNEVDPARVMMDGSLDLSDFRLVLDPGTPCEECRGQGRIKVEHVGMISITNCRACRGTGRKP